MVHCQTTHRQNTLCTDVFVIFFFFFSRGRGGFYRPTQLVMVMPGLGLERVGVWGGGEGGGMLMGGLAFQYGTDMVVLQRACKFKLPYSFFIFLFLAQNKVAAVKPRLTTSGKEQN